MKKVSEAKSELLATGDYQNLDLKNKANHNLNLVDFNRNNGRFTLIFDESAEYTANRKEKINKLVEENRTGLSTRNIKGINKINLNKVLNEKTALNSIYRLYKNSLLLDEDFILKNEDKIRASFDNGLSLLEEVEVFNRKDLFNSSNNYVNFIVNKLSEAVNEQVEEISDNMKNRHITKSDLLQELDDVNDKAENINDKVEEDNPEINSATDEMSENIKDNVARSIKDEQDRINKIHQDNEELTEVLNKNDDIGNDEKEDIKEVDNEIDEEQEEEGNDEETKGNTEEDENEEESKEDNDSSDDVEEDNKDNEEEKNEDTIFLAKYKKRNNSTNTGSLFGSIYNGIIKVAYNIKNESSKINNEINLDMVLAESVMFFTLLETLNITDLLKFRDKSHMLEFTKFCNNGFIL